MTAFRALFALTLLSGGLIGAGIVGLFSDRSIERAYGVVSACGVYAVIVVRRDGTSEIHHAGDKATEAEEQEIMALPGSQRVTVFVPCPPSASRILL